MHNGRLMDMLHSPQKPVQEAQWLIYATNASGTPFTYGKVSGFVQYGPLNSYKEDLKLVSKQYIGANGVMYSANLILFLPRSGVAIEFFNQFAQKGVIGSIKLVEVIMVSSSLGSAGNQVVARQTIEYTNCMITSYVQHYTEVEIVANYSSRSNTYSQYDNGAKTGNIVSSTVTGG